MGVNIQFDKARKRCFSQIKVYFVYLADTTEKIRSSFIGSKLLNSILKTFLLRKKVRLSSRLARANCSRWTTIRRWANNDNSNNVPRFPSLPPFAMKTTVLTGNEVVTKAGVLTANLTPNSPGAGSCHRNTTLVSPSDGRELEKFTSSDSKLFLFNCSFIKTTIRTVPSPWVQHIYNKSF